MRTAIKQPKVYKFTELNERGALLEDDIKDALRGFMDWIYQQLEKEYDYLTAREQVIAAIEANEYEFIQTGEGY